MTRREYDAAIRAAVSRPAAKVTQILNQDKRVDLGDGFHARMCRYRDMEAGGCAIYEARPLVCRLMGHVEWLPCPIEKVEKPLATPMALGLMRAYSTEERLTFEEWDAKLAIRRA
jgi:Fe-S-cluster containining protein